MVYPKFLAVAAILNVALFAEPSPTVASSNVNKNDPSNLNWDESESLKLYLQGQKEIQLGRPKEALMNFSEILEFFPLTESWPLACIEIAKIYRLNKNFHAAQNVLQRLSAHQSHYRTINTDVLFAQWDFLYQSEQIPNLLRWLDGRSEEEKKLFRLDPRIEEHFNAMTQDPKYSMEDILQLWNRLGHPSPLQSMFELINKNNGYLLNKQQSGVFLHHCLLAEKLNLIAAISRMMGKNGWADEAQLQFLAHRDDPNSQQWKGVWLRFLLNHQLYQEALALIPRGDENYAAEEALAWIGLKNWDRAAQNIIRHSDWITSSLPYEDLLKLAKGLSLQPQYHLLLEDMFAALKPPLKNMLKTEIMPRGAARVQSLTNIYKNDSFFGPRAAMLLGESFHSQRKLNDLIELHQTLILRFPAEKSIANEIQTAIATLQSLQGKNNGKIPQP
jgi:hypothetical protein